MHYATEKSNKSFLREIISLWSILGHSCGHLEGSQAVLGRFWVVLGTVLGDVLGFASAKPHFVKINVFEKNKVSRDDLSRSWDDLGGQEGPK